MQNPNQSREWTAHPPDRKPEEPANEFPVSLALSGTIVHRQIDGPSDGPLVGDAAGETLVKKVKEYLTCQPGILKPANHLLRACNEFCAMCKPVLLSQLNRYRPRKNESDDLFQEAMIEVIIGLRCFVWQGQDAFHAWLGTLVFHVVIKHRRKKSRLPVQELIGVLGSCSEPLDRDLSPAQLWEQKEEQELVQATVQQVEHSRNRPSQGVRTKADRPAHSSHEKKVPHSL
jgi:hypothetical protein